MDLREIQAHQIQFTVSRKRAGRYNFFAGTQGPRFHMGRELDSAIHFAEPAEKALALWSSITKVQGIV